MDVVERGDGLTSTVNSSKDLSADLAKEDLSHVNNTVYPKSAHWPEHDVQIGGGLTNVSMFEFERPDNPS